MKARDVVNAIRKNGYEKAQESFYTYGADGLIAACAFGQANLNLGREEDELEADALAAAMCKIGEDRFFARVDGILTYKGMGGRIIWLNDFTDKTLPQIADVIETEFSDLLDTEIMIDEDEIILGGSDDF